MVALPLLSLIRRAVPFPAILLLAGACAVEIPSGFPVPDGLVGGALDDGLLDSLDKLITKQIQPMTSTFVAPGYRRRVVAKLTRSLVRRLYQA